MGSLTQQEANNVYRMRVNDILDVGGKRVRLIQTEGCKECKACALRTECLKLVFGDNMPHLCGAAPDKMFVLAGSSNPFSRKTIAEDYYASLGGNQEQEQENKGENTMFDKLFNGVFGKVAPGMCRISGNGRIAVKTSNGYKSYNLKTKRLVNCTDFCFNMGDEMFFIVPTSKVHVGDIILVNKTPRCVVSTEEDEGIKVVNYETNAYENILPERHALMPNVYFYGKITSPFCGLVSGRKGIKNILQMAVMSNMMGGNGNIFGGMNIGGGDKGGSGSLMNAMMMMSMFGGKENNVFGDTMDGMFSGMFDEDDINPFAAMSQLDEDDAESGEETHKDKVEKTEEKK